MCCVCVVCFFFCQAEDGIRDLVRSRGLGDVYKRQGLDGAGADAEFRRQLTTRQPACQAAQHLALTFGQRLSLIHI